MSRISCLYKFVCSVDMLHVLFIILFEMLASYTKVYMCNFEVAEILAVLFQVFLTMHVYEQNKN